MWLEILEKYNYWQAAPSNLGVMRPRYLSSLQSFNQSPAMIVVTGARRVGKSILVRQFIDQLLREATPPQNILYFNFFLRALQALRSEEAFLAAIGEWQLLVDKKKPAYIVIDEVQELTDWDEIVASLIEDHTIGAKLIITGSNSQLLGSEATTRLSGRFYSLTVYPFSYEEFASAKAMDADDPQTFQDFILGATSPEAALAPNREAQENLIEGIVNTTIQKDIIQRFNPSSPALLAKIVEFMRLNSSQAFAMKTINDTLNNQVAKKDQIGLSKVEEYFSFLKNVYFCHECPVFSYRKRDVLNRSNNKFYLNDWGMALFTRDFERGRILENVIYLELRKKGYEVMTYFAYGNVNLEVDFWAKKRGRDLYVQVVWLMGDPFENKALYEREVGNLSAVKADGEKILVALDAAEVSLKNIKVLTPLQFVQQL